MLKFNNIKAKLENDSIISLTNNNITYIEPHTLKIKGITYLFFNEYEDVYIHDLGKSTNDFKEITNYSLAVDKIKENFKENHDAIEDLGRSVKSRNEEIKDLNMI